MVSVDIFQYTKFLEESAWPQAADYLLEGVRQLTNTGIDFLVISSNTGKKNRHLYHIQLVTSLLGHLAVPKITKHYPHLVVLHISDAVAFAIKKTKFKKVSL
jgi:aspartate/glutamate racemase